MTKIKEGFSICTIQRKIGMIYVKTICHNGGNMLDSTHSLGKPSEFKVYLNTLNCLP